MIKEIASHWDTAQVGDQTGRTAVVTGCNTGIGFEIARALLAHGATVVMACRDAEKMAAAQARLRAANPQARIEAVRLDLSDLASVRAAAETIRGRHDRLDLLINNAGAAWPPRSMTPEGVELQLAVNHIGHFALTGLLLDRMLQVPDSRVISTSSLAHRTGRINIEDISYEKRRYLGYTAYSQSKLANLVFMYELQRRLTHVGAQTRSMAAHPGGSKTELVRAKSHGRFAEIRTHLIRPMLMFQSAEKGALPSLRAALDHTARGGDYYGPGGFLELTGPPMPAHASRSSRDPGLGRDLWRYSEKVSSISYLSAPDGLKH